MSSFLNDSARYSLLILMQSFAWSSTRPLIYNSSNPYIIIIIIICSLLRVFHTRVTWWFLTGVWVRKVSSSFQDSSQYSGRSQKCSCLVISARHAISKSSRLVPNHFVTVLRALITIGISSLSWCNGYRRRIWTQRHEFKSWTIWLHFTLYTNTLGKVWIQ